MVAIKFFLQVVLTVAIAFIVDAFQFRMGLNEQKFRAIIGKSEDMYINILKSN